MTALLIKVKDGWVHYCPACERHHRIHERDDFNGDYAKPSFVQSNKIGGVWGIYDRDDWTGKWRMDDHDKPLPYCCHYIITLGAIAYQNDCTHTLAGRILPMEPLRDWFDPVKWDA